MYQAYALSVRDLENSFKKGRYCGHDGHGIEEAYHMLPGIGFSSIILLEFRHFVLQRVGFGRATLKGYGGSQSREVAEAFSYLNMSSVWEWIMNMVGSSWSTVFKWRCQQHWQA